MSAERCDVAIVGAGMAGSATAWWLARWGLDVAVVERFEAGHRNGSSHGATRLFRMGYEDPADVRRVADSLRLWRGVEDDAGEELLVTTGSIDHGLPPTVAAIEAALRREAVPCERLAPEAAAERWPGMRFDGEALLQPDGARALADATVAAFQRRAAHHGAQLNFATGPAQVLPLAGGGLAVEAGGRTWWPKVVVLTAGSWLPGLVAGRIPLPELTVTCEQVQHFAVKDPDAPWPSFIHHRDDPEVGTVYGVLTPGEGVKIATHHAGPVVDPDDRPFDADPAVADRVARYAAEWFPGVEPTPIHPARCLYTSTADQHHVMERHGNIVIGSPCSGHGFKFAPLTGRTLAELAVEGLAELKRGLVVPPKLPDPVA